MTFNLWYYVIGFCLFNFILGAKNDLDAEDFRARDFRACVIGAGFAGLATSRHLKDYGVNFTTFEASRYVGGTWRFDPHVGTDEDGLPLFTSQYKNLRTNTPRQTMEFAGFPFPEGTPTFPSGTCYYKYLKSFAKHHDLLQYIQFRSYVTGIKWVDDHWNLQYLKTDTRENVTEVCDFIVIASGEYSDPVMPHFEGMESFKGKVIHSHDYKEPEPYKGRSVLVVGAGASGLDLATHLSNITSKLVHSHHLNYNQPFFSKDYIKKPDIKAFTTEGVIFQDDSFEQIDDVILCTGYNYAHKFLDLSSGMTATTKYVLPLYQHMVNINHPSMVFVGVARGIINRVLDAQGEYAAALASGKFKLPSQEEMLKSWLDHVHSLPRLGLKIIHVNIIIDTDQYFENLTVEAGVRRAPPVLTIIRNNNAKNRLDDLLEYREYEYEIIDSYNYTTKYNPRQGFRCPIEDIPS
ncbi:hypothetical protein K1T71_010829 [Dendrolimus kikuchii]|uniref:Uncharacterized protein n=1 Tax=Dendrolimus kikuchii TaxID=765133 RepID=A0ACC1CQA0_9NEOP|nr:hypothetical protein K1T71_010829 [Dendrolimus kikuchii]